MITGCAGLAPVLELRRPHDGQLGHVIFRRRDGGGRRVVHAVEELARV